MIIFSNKKNIESVIIFIAFAILYLIVNYIWWKINTPIIPQNISATHFIDVFKNQLLYYNAPLITWIMKIMFFVFGKEYFDLQIMFVNYVFFLIALCFVYKIGVELKDKETGNIAMILFALTPAVYGMSRQYGHQDWHVMVAITVNIYCLIKLNYFEDRKWSILYGITVGLGLLIKDEFLSYFFTPWLYVVIRCLIEKARKDKIINIFITIIVGSFIAGWHYFRIEIINKILCEPNKEIVQSFILDGINKMTLGLTQELFSLLFAIVFIFGLLYSVFIYRNKNKWIIFLWFLVPWLIIIFMQHHKESEYAIGVIPALVIFSSICISNIKYKYLKIITVIIIGIIGLNQCFSFSYGKKIKYSYFNDRLISYNKKDVEPLIRMTNICKNYSDKVFFIWDGFLKYCSEIKLLFDFNDIKNIYNCDFCNSIKADIIVDVDFDNFSTERILNMYLRDVEYNYSEEVFGDLLQQNVYKEEEKKLEKILDIISNDYYVQKIMNEPIIILYIKNEKNN